MDDPATLIVDCAGVTQTFTPDQAPAVIGRGPDADVSVADPRVARAHVRLEVERGGWRAVDNNSRTGMFVGGVRRNVVDIEDGSTINVGSAGGTAITFHFADAFTDSDARDLTGDEVPVDIGIARAGSAVAARRRELDI